MVAHIPIASPDLSGNELKYVTDAVKSGWLTHRGKYEPLFEKALTAFLGKPTIATSSGTGALHLALLALGIGPHDEVICPALTFAAPASAILAVGARPVLVDVRKDQPTLDWEEVRHKVNHKTKAIIPVHLFGEDAGIKYFRQAAIIEDACEAFGYLKPRGDFACYSFYGNKIITTGEGGALAGDDLTTAGKYRDGGFNQEYYHDTPGLNYRMTNLQAAVGLAQIERIQSILDARNKVLEIYKTFPGVGKWLRVVTTDRPEHLRSYLKAHGVETRPMFYPLHLMPPYKDNGSYPNAEWWWKNSVLLPVTVTEDQAHFIVDKVHEHFDLCRGTDGGSRMVAQSRPEFEYS